MKALMLGSGHFPPERKITLIGAEPPPPEWITLDLNRACDADIVFDLEELEHGQQLPFAPESFDEVHAYQVLEHFGKQGDYIGFFRTFRELWRIIKPEGLLIGDTPAHGSRWAWGDPGHTRVISEGSLSFLTRRSYEGLGKTTSTDYRRYVSPNWWLILHASTQGPLPGGGFGETDRFAFVLKKVD